MPRQALALHARQVLQSIGEANAELQREFFGPLKESGCMTYEFCPACCGKVVAKTSTRAYMDLEAAERAIAEASQGAQLDGRPLAEAAQKSEEAREYLQPLIEKGPADSLEVEGPMEVQEVESVQSASTRTDIPQGSENSMLPLFPASLLLPRLPDAAADVGSFL
eukprot:TRINITY_DN81304_c0_g1_i1.p1 TRINITY_DN81304_c0_g1~~TRINITY_DN81304_c0_g1_i1.p1  ORF type:complete len:187 (+),score=48.52 TRINITY_DN81304_c0_g1_i1:67-561(+)